MISWLGNSLASAVYDEILLNSADSVVARVESDKGEISVNLPEPARKVLRHEDKDTFYYQVLGPDDRLIDCDEYIPIPAVRAQSGQHVFYNTVVDGNRVRALELRAPHPQLSPKYVSIEVAETFNTRQAFSNLIVISLLATQILFIAGSAVAIWFGAGRGLMPLNNLEQTLSRRSPSDLEPIAIADAPAEALSLVQTINTLLGQIKGHIDRQANYAANVAHQLRTPLSGLKTYVGLALRQSKDNKVQEFLALIDQGVERLIALIEQMLLLSRSDPSVLAHKIDSKVDLNTIILEATAELMPHSAKKHIDLEVIPLTSPVEVYGDPLSLLELTKNLTENAIAHSPSGSSVQVKIDTQHGPALIVEDNGPGIPVEERNHVFEPFYRPATTVTVGTGLGLSIARDIANAHRATITIEDGEKNKGTRVVVSFPNEHQS
jgi:two-component system sensor histidine kinase TctE